MYELEININIKSTGEYDKLNAFWDTIFEIFKDLESGELEISGGIEEKNVQEES